MTIGNSIQRTDAVDKAAGKVKYTADKISSGCMHARLVVSTEAHAGIRNIDISGALAIPGVGAVLTGKDCPELIGSEIQDMPILAQDVVRYYGEPVALVVADEEWQAVQGAALVKVDYLPLPVVNDVDQALLPQAPLFHPAMHTYKLASDSVYPIPGSNIVNHIKIRKGDMDKGWNESDVIVEGRFRIPQAAHCYMETKTAAAEIMGSGSIEVEASSQGPQLSEDTREGFIYNDRGQFSFAEAVTKMPTFMPSIQRARKSATRW